MDQDTQRKMLIPTAGAWDELPHKGYFERTTLTVNGVVIASALGGACEIPDVAEGKTIQVHRTVSYEPLFPDEVGARLNKRKR